MHVDAGSYDLYYILLSQLNRNIEQEFRAKQQYQPLLTDLFGGDSIGQDAHVVMMLQRPYDYMVSLTNTVVRTLWVSWQYISRRTVMVCSV